MISIETNLNAGKGSPSGADVLKYPDLNGVSHSFSENDFTSFVSVVREYTYSLRAIISGSSVECRQRQRR
jgi:hypothetical protein